MCEHHHDHDHQHSHEHGHEHASCGAASLKRVFWAAVLFFAAILLPLTGSIKFALFLIAYLAAGGDVLLRAFKNILKGEVFDENFLMGIATLGAFAIKEYPEAVMVMILYQIGEYLQERAVEKSRASVSELMDIRPDYANIVREDGSVEKTSPENVKVNDIIIVKTGEKIPLDGIVKDGRAVLDTSALTGEPALKEIKQGDEAISGCINTNGMLKIAVTKPFGESTVSKILELVQNASSRKAKAEKFITKFAGFYTPVVVICAVLLAALPPLILGGQFSVWLGRALTFLVISCPCALVISVPLSFFAGIGGASKCGILIKGSSYLEALSKPEAVVLDKTGTLTKGTFKVTQIVPFNGFSKEELLEKAATAEYYSIHPVALSLKEAFAKKIDSSIVKDVEEIAGNGIKACVNGTRILAGNDKLMHSYDIEFTAANESGTVIYAAEDEKYLGYIVISDEIKEDAQDAIVSLKKLVKQTVMLTGDSSVVAKETSERLGLDNAFAELLPADKVEKLEELISKKQNDKTIIFVGDGINDAPVLTRADVGIAMGALGSDAAIEAADVVIMDDKPSKIPAAIAIAKKTMRIVKQNIVFAISVKVLFLVLGAMGFITMWGAVFADVGVTLIAVLNSLRALRVRFDNNA